MASISSKMEQPTKRSAAKKIFDKAVGNPENQPESVHTIDYIRGTSGDLRQGVIDYVSSLFPFLQWAPRYNLTWLLGDLIAGITVGMVLVPQSLSYAKLANLPIEYGLYSSFIGVLTYAFFATSKDVSIGPVAVMSLEVGHIITHIQSTAEGAQYAAPQIATTLAFVCGFIVLGIGLLRLGWLVEFIPQPAVSGFMTGSAISIAAGQVPALLGIAKRFDTKQSTYKVIILTLQNLKFTKLDAAFGIPALVGLYAIKWSLAWAGERYPRFRRPAFFIACLRHAFIIIIFTIASWQLVKGKDPKKLPISILGNVPRGLKHVGRPKIDPKLISLLGSKLPVATIILLLEHISIAKSFGRLNGYKINPNQELIAIGVNNTLGTLFNAYPSTGSFSRSALKSKSGVRTPAAGIPTGIVVLIALYALTDAFYFIPNAALSALIIHAVADLVASLPQSYAFWRVSPLEFIIFLAAVFVSIFSTIENGIYTSLAASIVLLLFRLARPRGHFLGRVRIRPEDNETGPTRDVYVPLCGDGGVTNRDIKVEAPPAGIVIYRFEESFLYPNASLINSTIVEHVKAKTRRGRDYTNVPLGDRPWNDPGPKRGHAEAEFEAEQGKPLLRAVVLDFAAVANLDTTGVQNLVDTRKEVEKWADAPVEFHFSGILSPWVRRALIAGGFGQGIPRHGTALEVAPVVRADNALSPHDQRQQDLERAQSRHPEVRSNKPSFEKVLEEGSSSSSGKDSPDPIDGSGNRSLHSIDSRSELPLLDRATPFFHFDLADALNAVRSGSHSSL